MLEVSITEKKRSHTLPYCPTNNIIAFKRAMKCLYSISSGQVSNVVSLLVLVHQTVIHPENEQHILGFGFFCFFFKLGFSFSQLGCFGLDNIYFCIRITMLAFVHLSFNKRTRF